MCPILWELWDHVPLVRTTKCNPFQESICISLPGSPILFLFALKFCASLKCISHPWKRGFLFSLWTSMRSGVCSPAGAISARPGVAVIRRQGLAWIESRCLMGFLNFHSILSHSSFSTRLGRASTLPWPMPSCLCKCPRWKYTQGLSRTARTSLQTIWHFGYFQIEKTMTVLFPTTPLCSWMRCSWRGSVYRDILGLESQCLPVISWDETSTGRKRSRICRLGAASYMPLFLLWR